MTFGIYLVIFFLAADICHNEGKTSVRQFSVNNVRRVNIPHRSRTNTCDLNFAKDKCSVDEHGLFKMSMSTHPYQVHILRSRRIDSNSETATI